MVADTIRNEYYYDESAGIRQCLIKVMGVANKRLAHQRDRYGMGHRGDDGGPDRRRRRRRPGPRAVRRDGRPGGGLPHPPGPPVDAARPQPGPRPARRTSSSPRSGAASSRSATRCASCRPTSSPRSGPTPSRTRWSRSTRSRRSSTSTRGSWPPTARAATAPLAFEANEVGATHKAEDARPGPARRAAGRRSRPVAHPARRHRDRRRRRRSAPARPRRAARPATGSSARSGGIQDLLPRRKTGARKVTGDRVAHGDAAPGGRRPARVRRRRRRARRRRVRGRRASASSRAAIPSLTAAKRAFEDRPGGPRTRQRAGRRPHRGRPAPGAGAAQLRLPASSTRPRRRGYPRRRRSPRCARRPSRASTACTASTTVTSSPLFTFPKDKPVELDGARPRVRRRAVRARHRQQDRVADRPRQEDRRRPILKSGQRASGARVADPKLITAGGPDVLILDEQEHAVALAAAEQLGPGDAGPDPGQELRRRGATTSRTCRRSSPTSTPRSTSSTSSTRRSRTSWSSTRPMTGPATTAPGRAPAHRPAGRRDHRPHDRRRHLRRRERRGRARDPGDELDAGAARGHPAPPDQRLHDALVADPGQRQPEQADRRAVRVRRDQPPGRRVQQVGRQVPRPVPAHGRRRRVVRPQGPRSCCRRPRRTRRRRCGGSRARAEQRARSRRPRPRRRRPRPPRPRPRPRRRPSPSRRRRPGADGRGGRRCSRSATRTRPGGPRSSRWRSSCCASSPSAGSSWVLAQGGDEAWATS